MRVCLEDTVMGKLHGLTIGLDICSTLHMDVTLDDLDWCIEQVMPANPAYLMALPTKNDPMLSYLTTAFQDHVRVREQFGYKVDDRMWAFFQRARRHRRRRPADRALRRPALGLPAVPPRAGATRGRTPRSWPRPTRDRARARPRRVPRRRATAPKPSDMDPALDRQVRRALRGREVVHPRRASRGVRRRRSPTPCRSRRAAAIATTTSCTRRPARC